jgi:glycolate oxidase iron-sulfur subunit
MHAQRITRQPMDVLRAIPGLELVPLTESDVCCGSAGIYNLVEPDVSNVVLDRKLAHIAEAKPELVATGNPGCMMQIGAGLVRAGSDVRTVHPVELLDESYAKRDSAKRG